MKPLREELPFFRKLGDHECQIRVHAVADRRHREIAEALGLVFGGAIPRILQLGAGAQELRRRDHHLVIGRDDLCQGRDTGGVKVRAGQRVRCRIEMAAFRAGAVLVKPLQRLEEEGQSLRGQCREPCEVDRLLFFFPVGQRDIAVEGNAGGLRQALRVLRADQGFLVEAPHHHLPNFLPAGAENALEEFRFAPDALAKVQGQGGVFQVVELAPVAHDAPDDGGSDVENEIHVHEAPKQDQRPSHDHA
mmetsp:Transcript_26942/g.78180  ORF Transcript_26942/g.78180 Transcript_26942/m.78180 type:complete len:248 (+) Transcript_26942:2646-3389(+)